MSCAVTFCECLCVLKDVFSVIVGYVAIRPNFSFVFESSKPS